MECRNHSNHTLADSLGAKDDSKTSKLGTDLPLGVHDQPQCAEIGANPFTLFWGPESVKAGTVAIPIHGNPMGAASQLYTRDHSRAVAHNNLQLLGTAQGRECTRGHCACVTLPLSDGAKRAQC